MAVTFTVEDGSCVEDANSYVTLEFADDYLSIKPNYTAWSELTEAVRQNYLMWASRLLTQRVIWQQDTTKVCDNNNLSWPRQYARDRECNAIPEDEVPIQVMEATVEIAHHLFTLAVDPSVPSGSPAGEIKRIKADVVEIEYQDANSTGINNKFPLGINRILYPLGSISGVGGSSAAPIRRA